MSTSYPLIITKSNLVQGSNNTFRYNLSQNVDMSNVEIALQQASIWFSWRNITSLKQNNQFEIIHPATGSSNVTLSLTIPDGGYNISDLNNFLRFYLVSNGYFIENNTTNEQVVYCELVVNPTLYTIEFISYPLPTALPAGFTAGSSITFPAGARGPQLVINQTNFGKIIGFPTGTFPGLQPTSIFTSSSTLVPEVSDTSNVLVTLDSANNPFAPNSKIIHAISPAGAAYASLIKSEPNELSWVPQQNGYRNQITIQLTNQNLVPLDLYDPDVTIKLLLRKKM